MIYDLWLLGSEYDDTEETPARFRKVSAKRKREEEE